LLIRTFSETKERAKTTDPMSNYPLILGWSLREEHCVGFQNIEICHKEYNPRGTRIGAQLGASRDKTEK